MECWICDVKTLELSLRSRQRFHQFFKGLIPFLKFHVVFGVNFILLCTIEVANFVIQVLLSVICLKLVQIGGFIKRHELFNFFLDLNVAYIISFIFITHSICMTDCFTYLELNFHCVLFLLKGFFIDCIEFKDMISFLLNFRYLKLTNRLFSFISIKKRRRFSFLEKEFSGLLFFQ